MLHARRIAPAGQWPAAQSRGTVTLEFDNRYRRRLRLSTDAGEPVMLDLAQPVVLGDGDALVVEEGGFIAVRAALEDLVEVTAPPDLLARLAWHIGNRHFPAELHADRILIRDDHVMVDMLIGFGAEVRRVRAPFNPEGGAYAHANGHGHDGHDHDHGHGHDH